MISGVEDWYVASNGSRVCSSMAPYKRLIAWNFRCPLGAVVPDSHGDGQGGIRTLDTLAGIPVFETGGFNRSPTCPARRTGWDSNPRNGCPLTRFPSVRLQPLGHPSDAEKLIRHRAAYHGPPCRDAFAAAHRQSEPRVALCRVPAALARMPEALRLDPAAVRSAQRTHEVSSDHWRPRSPPLRLPSPVDAEAGSPRLPAARAICRPP